MKIQGTMSVSASRNEVWETLTDPQKVTGLLPDGEITSADEQTWRARLAPQTALGKSPFDFTFTLVKQQASEHVKVSGHGYGAQNVVDLTASLDLSERDGGTEVNWEADVRLGGVLASLGQRSLPYVIRRQIEDILRAIEAQHSGVAV